MLVFSSHGIILSIITCRTIPFRFAAIFVFMFLYFTSSINLLSTFFSGLHIINIDNYCLNLFINSSRAVYSGSSSDSSGLYLLYD